MHVTVSYSQFSRHEGDAEALRDLVEWMPRAAWDVAVAQAQQATTSRDVALLNTFLSFAGVSGYPFFALCRTLCLPAYKEWMADTEYGDPYPMDAEGFAL